jgi:hypothetical protein
LIPYGPFFHPLMYFACIHAVYLSLNLKSAAIGRAKLSVCLPPRSQQVLEQVIKEVAPETLMRN